MCFCYFCTGERSLSEAPSYWWVAGPVIVVLVLVVVGVLAYLKVRGEERLTSFKGRRKHLRLRQKHAH